MKNDRTRWSWPGAIALVLASCLGLGWLAAVLIAGAAQLRGVPVSAAALQALGSVAQVLAGSLSTYLGFTVRAARRAPRSAPSRRTAPPSAPVPSTPPRQLWPNE